MTTVCAYKDSLGHITLAADSQVTSNVAYTLKARSKLIQAGELIMGICGIIPPPHVWGNHPASKDGVQALAAEYLELMTDFGHGGSDDGVHSLPICAIVCGPGIGPFLLGPTGEIFEVAEEYLAVGNGSELALGVLCYMRSVEPPVDANTAVTAAMYAAVVHDPMTNGPVYTMQIAPPTPIDPNLPVEPVARKPRVRTKRYSKAS